MLSQKGQRVTSVFSLGNKWAKTDQLLFSFPFRYDFIKKLTKNELKLRNIHRRKTVTTCPSLPNAKCKAEHMLNHFGIACAIK